MPTPKDFLIFRSEIVAHDGDEIYRREKAGCDREVGGRATERALHLSIRAFQSIKCNGTHDE